MGRPEASRAATVGHSLDPPRVGGVVAAAAPLAHARVDDPLPPPPVCALPFSPPSGPHTPAHTQQLPPGMDRGPVVGPRGGKSLPGMRSAVLRAVAGGRGRQRGGRTVVRVRDGPGMHPPVHRAASAGIAVPGHLVADRRSGASRLASVDLRGRCSALGIAGRSYEVRRGGPSLDAAPARASSSTCALVRASVIWRGPSSASLATTAR